MKKISLAAATLVTAALFGLTACGDGDDSAGTSGTGSADPQLMQKFVTCLKDHGVDVPANSGAQEVAPAPGSNAKWDAAQAACAKYAPNEDPAGPEVTEADQDRAVKKAECLRKEGINAKDPEPGSATITVEEDSATTQAKLVAAYTKCNKLVPSSPVPTAPN